MQTNEVVSAPLAKIDPSPTQPRKHFRGLAEMAATIKEHGILQKPTVRTHPTKAGGFELIFGERRVRAAKLAGLEEVLVEVNDSLSVDEIEELQLIENVQREDLDPFEEGDSYKALRAKGKTLEQIAAMTRGKSPSYVSAKMRLADVCKEARKAFADGKLHEASTLEVARLASSQQAEATKVLVEAISRDGDPVGAREARRIIVSKFLLRIAGAGFNPGDATLLPKAGACTTCPKRTGNQPELFGDVLADKKGSDVCTDGTCFQAKKDADWARVVAVAKETGRAVIDGKKAKEFVAPYGNPDVLNVRGSGFVDLEEKQYHRGDMKSPADQLGKKAKDLEVTLLRNPSTGKIHKLVKASEVEALLPKDRSSSETATKAKTPAEKRKAKAERLASVEVLAQVYERSSKRDGFGKAIAKVLLDFCTPSGPSAAREGLASFLERTGLVIMSGTAKLKPQDERDKLAVKLLEQKIESATEEQLRGLIVMMLVKPLLWWRSGGFPDDCKIILDALKVDAKAIVANQLHKLTTADLVKAKKHPAPAKSTAKKLAKGFKVTKKAKSK